MYTSVWGVTGPKKSLLGGWQYDFNISQFHQLFEFNYSPFIVVCFFSFLMALWFYNGLWLEWNMKMWTKERRFWKILLPRECFVFSASAFTAVVHWMCHCFFFKGDISRKINLFWAYDMFKKSFLLYMTDLEWFTFLFSLFYHVSPTVACRGSSRPIWNPQPAQ